MAAGSKYIKNKTSKQVEISDFFVVNNTEFIIMIAIFVNLMYVTFFPVYRLLHGYFTPFLFVFSALVIFSNSSAEMNRQTGIGFVIIAGLSMMTILMNGSGVGVMVYLVWPLSIILIFFSNPVSDAFINKISFLMFCGWLLSVIMTYRYTDSFFDNYATIIIKGTINPNTTACLLGCTFFLGRIIVDRNSKSALSAIVMTLVCVLALYRTRSRGALFSFLVCLVFWLFKEKITKSRKAGITILTIILLAGVLFPVVYVFLYEQGIITYDMVFVGKSVLTGRQYIWINLWEYLKRNPGSLIWGVGYNTTLFHTSFNLHNGYLQVFAQFGIFLFFIYLLFFGWSVSCMYDSTETMKDVPFLCYLTLLFFTMVGYVETIFTNLPFLIYLALVIGIGFSRRKGDRV